MSKRGNRIPVAAWWFEAANRALGDRSPLWLASKTGEKGTSNISRCLNGDIPTLHLVQRISDALGIPRPVFLPQTEQEALAITGVLALRKVDDSLRSIAEEADAPLDDAPPPRRRRRGS